MKLKSIIVIAVVMAISIPAFAQKTVRVRFKKGQTGAVINAKGSTTFLVDLRKNQTYAATAVIKSNCDVGMSGLLEIVNNKGEVLAEPEAGIGYFFNQWGGKTSITGTYKFFITTNPCAEYEFAVEAK